MRFILVALLVALVTAQDKTQDKLLVAVCSKNIAQLKAIVDQAAARGQPIEGADGDDKETIAAAIYASLQKEKSNAGGGDVNDFPGCDGITEAAAPSRKPPPKSGAGGGAKKEMWAQVAAQLLKTQDKDGDGKLTREEMQQIIEQTNAKAKAQGEATPADFFTQVDSNGDGFAEREELEGYFKEQMKNQQGGGGTPGKPTGGTSKGTKSGATGGAPKDAVAAMFAQFDADKDGQLSLEEMGPVISRTNQNAANQQAGETGEDFFKTLDANGDGYIDKEEAKLFFKKAEEMVGGSGGKDEV